MFCQMGDEDQITCACATAVHACSQRRHDCRSTDYLYVYSHPPPPSPPPPPPPMLQTVNPYAPACLTKPNLCGQVGTSLIQLKLLETCSPYSYMYIFLRLHVCIRLCTC